MPPWTTEEQKQLTPEDQEFAEQLLTLAENTHPAPHFRQELATRLRAESNHKPFVMRPRWSIAAAMLLVGFVALFWITPLSSFAQDFIDDFFNRVSDSETFDQPKTFSLDPTPVPETLPNTTTDLQRVAGEAPFTVYVPNYIPEGYVLVDVDYDVNARQVYQLYMKESNGVYDSFSITQMRLEDAIELDIGESAAVTDVTINGNAGEAVTGSWRAITSHDEDSMTVEGREWDQDFPYTQMLWSNDTFVYWMQSPIGQPHLLDLDEWMRIAESLQ